MKLLKSFTIIMEKQLREQLLENEQLLWTGRPEPFDTLDKTNKTSIIVGLVVKVLIAWGILFLFFSSAKDGGGIHPGVIICILAATTYAMMNPFLIARRLRGKTIYGLTDKRVIRSGAMDNAVPYERIKKAVLRTDKDGYTSLLCGSRACDLKPRQWRGEADAAFINNNGEPEASRVILYALPMDDALKSLLNQYLPIQKE